MKTYFVVNEKEREIFEKKFHVPFGYYTVPYFQTEDGAVGYVENSRDEIRNNLIVEKYEGGVCEVIYRGFWYTPESDKIKVN
jgi:hypothetical protein